jgi:Zn-dependent membrane protease YugP
VAIALIVIVVLVGIAVFPQIWVKSIIKRHGEERADIPGTGGELARHLLDGMKLGHVKVEQTDQGDHYDPVAKVVRLSPQHMNGRSLAAVVIAAHEVGHAMQDATSYPPLRARTRLARQAQTIEMIGAVVMLAAPLVMALLRTPHALLFELAAGFVLLATSLLMHAVTLPVEFDASFRRALPVLEQGGFVNARDMPAARQLLRAAAFTYVAAAAMSLINIARWLQVLRF